MSSFLLKNCTAFLFWTHHQIPWKCILTGTGLQKSMRGEKENTGRHSYHYMISALWMMMLLWVGLSSLPEHFQGSPFSWPWHWWIPLICTLQSFPSLPIAIPSFMGFLFLGRVGYNSAIKFSFRSAIEQILSLKTVLKNIKEICGCFKLKLTSFKSIFLLLELKEGIDFFLNEIMQIS